MPSVNIDKTFDEFLQEILTDYSNLDSNPDVSQGGMPWIAGSVLASMLWGINRLALKYVKKRPIPDVRFK